MSIVLDPWNPIDFILQQGINKIMGPLTENKKRFVLEFKLDNNNLYTINNEEEFKHLYLKLGDIGILENVSKSSYYRGSELVLLGLQIFYKLGIKKCSLVDTSFFVCDRKMNFFSNKENINKKEEIQYKLINLFRHETTFYSPFGFRPFYKFKKTNSNFKNNRIQIKNIKHEDEDKNDEIKELLNKLFSISWENINNYINLLYSNIERYRNNYKIRNFYKFKIYWDNLYKSWNNFYNKFHEISPSPFRSFSYFNHEECNLFINWLELYSFSYIEYNTSIFEEFNGTIAGINEFKELKNLIESVYWINTNINSQSFVSILKKNI